MNTSQRTSRISESEIQLLFEQSADAILLIENGIFTDCNQAAVKMMCAANKAEFLSLHPSKLSPEYQPDGRLSSEKVDDMMRIALEKGSNRFEWIYRRVNGTDFPVEVLLTSISTGDRQIIHTVWRDITERKQAETELQQEKALSDAIINGLPGVFYLFDTQGRMIRWNKQYEQVMGLTPEEAAAMNAIDSVADEDKAHAAAAIQRVFVEGQATVEAHFLTKDGRRIPFYLAGQRLQLGDQLYLAGTGIDITERKQAEAALRESEERFRRFSEVANEGLIFHEKGIIIDINTALAKMFGYSNASELIGRNVLEFIAPEARESVIEQMKSGSTKPYEALGVRKDGTVFPVEASAQMYEYQGRTVRVAYIHDITERKQAETELQREKALSDAIINGLPGVFYLFDTQGKLFRWNKQYEQVMGLTPEEAAAMNAIDSVADEDKARAAAAIQRVFVEGQATVEAHFLTKDGRRIPFYLAGQRLQLGDQLYLAGTGIDITERKQAEEALQKSEENFRAIADFTYGWESWLNPEGKFLYVSPACERISEYAPTAFMDNPRLFAEITYPEDRTLVENHLRDHQSVADTKPIEFRIITKSGKVRWISHACQAIYDAKGTWQGRRGSNLDVTERKLLEEQVQTAFERRGLQVQLSTQVSQAIAAATSLEDLYERVVTQVKEQFGYYHTQLLRYDADRKAIVLVTGYGEIGAKMLAARHRLPVGEGLIGTAAATGETVLRPTLESDPDWKPHPLLPETKGEIAIPIKLGEQILGVLDVQSSAADALGMDDQHLLEGLCGQIATAIEGTRLRQEMNERLEEISRLYRAMSHEGWQAYREGQTIPTGFMFDEGRVKPVKEHELADELFAKVPLVVPGGEVIGSLSIAEDERRPLSAQEQTFLQQVSEQLALALESARLFEQTQLALSQVQEGEARLRTLIENAPEAIVVVDVTTALFLTPNENATKLYGLSREELTKVGPAQMSPPTQPDGRDSTEKAMEKIGEAMQGGAPVFEWLYRSAQGQDIPCEVRLVRLPGDRPLVRASVTDITERKKAEEKIRLAQERAQIILESVTVPMVITRISDSVLTFVNQPATEIVQMKYEDAINKPSPNFYYNLEDRKKYIDELSAKGKVSNMTLQLLRGNKEPFWALMSGRIFDYQGEASILTTFMDITDRISAQEVVTKRAAELQTVAEVSTTAATTLEPDRLLQAVVDLTKEQFGLYHAHIYIADESWNTLLLAAGAGEVGRKLVAEGHAIPMSLEPSLVARAARERKALIVNDVSSEPGFLPNPLLPETCAEMAVPMIVGDKLLGVFDVQSTSTAGFSEEDANIYITLAAQVGVALQNARLYVEQAATVTQLRELDRLKSSFLANMSHELRTPLNSILGFADVIIEELDGPLTDNMSSDLRLIQKNGQHLLHLINDVLDMAKIEAGRMNLNPEHFTACEVLEEVTSITSTLASEKNLALFIDQASDQSVKIYADRTRLRQVMINLVNNAIKFTETGNISLKLVTLDSARVLFSVKDTGIGIPPDKLEAVFQEFTQVDSSSTRKAGGTGLGLPISRKLVEMHGGRLWAESTGIPGEGSTFFVELPIEARITETIEKQA